MFGIERGRAGRPGDPIVVTGASTGLGLETALQLAERGFRVFATVRDSRRGPPCSMPRGSAGSSSRCCGST